MWTWIYCFLSGSHEYQVTCEPGQVFLCCRACGRRSTGWELRQERTAREASILQPARIPALSHQRAR